MAALAGADSGEVVPDHRIRREVGRPQLGGQARRPAGPRRPDGLGTGDDGHREGPGADVARRPADQPLGTVAPDGGRLAGAPAVRRSAAANSPARAGPDRVMTSTTDSRSMRSRRPGATAKASSQARAIRSTGVTSSVRSMDWPDATTTGMRSGSLVAVLIGGRWTRSCRGASYHRHPVRTGPDRLSCSAVTERSKPDSRQDTHQDIAARRQRTPISHTHQHTHRSNRGGDIVLDWPATDEARSRCRRTHRRVPPRSGHGRLPDRGWLQRPGPAGQQLVRLGVGGPGRAVGERRRLLGPAGGVAGPGGRTGLQQLPPECRVGPGRPRTGRDGPVGPGALPGHRDGLRRTRPRAVGHAAPLHPSGLVGRRLLAAPGRP